MSKLVLSMDGLVLKEILLNKESITIGRKPHNNVQIDNLAISGEHAIITTILNDAFLEDCNSTNGTYVNGQQVKKHVLKDNDIIELGKYRLKYIAEDEEPDSQTAAQTAGDGQTESANELALQGDDGRKTASPEVIRAAREAARNAQGQQHISTSVSSAAETQILSPKEREVALAAGGEGAVGMLRVLTGSRAGKELKLYKTQIKLGKPGKQVAVVVRQPQGYFLSHFEGANKPLVNGQEIGMQPRQLKKGDRIEIAGIGMEFFLSS